MSDAEKSNLTKGLLDFRKKVGSEHGAQAKAARKLEINEVRISRILSGERKCPLDIALRIEKIYGTPTKWWVVFVPDSKAA